MLLTEIIDPHAIPEPIDMAMILHGALVGEIITNICTSCAYAIQHLVVGYKHFESYCLYS